MRHEIEIRRGDYAPYWCRRCEWRWQSGPTGECPGIKRYSAATATLKSRSQWRHLGRQPTSKPVGTVWTAHEWMMLYDERDTEPIPPPSDAQRQAWREARRRRRTCQDCQRVMKRVSDLDERGYRAACAGNWMTREEVRIANVFDGAVSWARHLLSLPPETWAICDTETSDLHGATRYAHSPQGTISPAARAIHHITDDELRTALMFPDCYGGLGKNGTDFWNKEMMPVSIWACSKRT